MSCAAPKITIAHDARNKDSDGLCDRIPTAPPNAVKVKIGILEGSRTDVLGSDGGSAGRSAHRSHGVGNLGGTPRMDCLQHTRIQEGEALVGKAFEAPLQRVRPLVSHRLPAVQKLAATTSADAADGSARTADPQTGGVPARWRHRSRCNRRD